nr:hypothetical protein [Tanacetum cinerariifolium]
LAKGDGRALGPRGQQKEIGIAVELHHAAELLGIILIQKRDDREVGVLEAGRRHAAANGEVGVDALPAKLRQRSRGKNEVVLRFAQLAGKNAGIEPRRKHADAIVVAPPLAELANYFINPVAEGEEIAQTHRPQGVVGTPDFGAIGHVAVQHHPAAKLVVGGQSLQVSLVGAFAVKVYLPGAGLPLGCAQYLQEHVLALAVGVEASHHSQLHRAGRRVRHGHVGGQVERVLHHPAVGQRVGQLPPQHFRLLGRD